MDNVQPNSKKPEVLGYAAPPFRDAAVKFWSNGSLLDLREDAELPSRCVKCNTDSGNVHVVMRLNWVDPSFRREYSTLRMLPWFRLIWAMNTIVKERQNRKFARVKLPVCKKHRLVRVIKPGMSFLIIAAGLGLISIGIRGNNQGNFGVAGVFAVIVGVILFQYWPPIIVPTRIDHGLVTLKGCCKPFLESLPVGRASASSKVAPKDLAAATARLTAPRR